MPQHLRDAARRRHEHSLQRAKMALEALTDVGDPVIFAAVARKAGTSTDFLYRHSELRTRIEQLRNKPRSARTPETPTESSSAAVRALASRLKELRRKHHQEIADLRNALSAAHGENLALRRKLAIHQ